jgi:hypothetical protein
MPTDVTVANREYIQIYLRAENIKHAYKRIGYDLLTFLGDVGGLFDIIMLLGRTLTMFFAARLF